MKWEVLYTGQEATIIEDIRMLPTSYLKILMESFSVLVAYCEVSIILKRIEEGS